MSVTDRPLAKVIANVPADRVLTFGSNGRLPQIGEPGEVDQVFAAATGVQMSKVYLPDSTGRQLWVADMLESAFCTRSSKLEPLVTIGRAIAGAVSTSIAGN
jgi:hypothetical protein